MSRTLVYVLLGKDQLSSVSKKAGDNVESDSGRIKGAFGAIAGTALKVGGATAAIWGGGNALAAGIKYNAQLEQAKIGFTTMLGSAQKAGAFLNTLQAFAAKTPFNFPELVTASQRMIAFGISSKDVIPDLTAIGDAAAGLGIGSEGVDRITTAIGQMQAKTRVQSDEILQLTESGVPALRILANEYGVTTKQMQEMITKGVVQSSVAIPKLLQGIEKGTRGAAGATTAFGGLMAAQSHSLTGIFSNFVDVANKRLGQLVAPAIPFIKSSLGVLTNLMSGGGGLKTALNFIKTTFGGTFRQLGSFVRDLGATFQNIWPVIAPFAKGLAALIPAVLITSLRLLGALLGGVVGPALKSVSGFIRDNKTLFQSLAVAVAVVTLAMNSMRIALAIYFAVARVVAIATRLMTVAQWALNVALNANPIGIVVVALLALGAAFAWAWTHSATFRNIVIGVWNAIKNTTLAVVNAIVNAVKTGFNAVTGAVSAALNWIKTHWPLLLAILTGPIGLAALIIIRHWDNIKNTAANAFNAVVSFFRGLPGRILGAIGNVGRLLTGIGGQLISGLFSGITGALRSVGSWVKNNIFDPIVGAIKGLFGIHSPSTIMAELGGHLVGGLIKGVLSRNPKDFILKVFGSIPSALGALIGKGLVNLARLPGKALRALGSLGGKIGGFFGRLFGGGGGSGVQRWAGLVSQVLAMLGQPQSYLGLVLRRMNQESGGNPAAINLWDSNAKAGYPSQGLMQTIPQTFAAYAGPFRSRGILDPLANIYAGLNYALHTYGSLAALARPGGYAKGTSNARRGWAWVGERGRELLYFRGGEGVVPGNQVSAAGAGGTTLIWTGDVVIRGHALATKQEIGREVSDALAAFKGKGGRTS